MCLQLPTRASYSRIITYTGSWQKITWKLTPTCLNFDVMK